MGLLLTTTLAAVGDPAASGDALSALTSYGPLGVFVIGILTKQIVPGWLYTRTENENDRLRTLIDDKVYPALESSTRATEKAAEVMHDIASRRQGR